MNWNPSTWGYSTIVGAAILGLLPLAVYGYEIPIVIGTFLWAAVFILLAWHLLRDRGIRPGATGY